MGHRPPPSRRLLAVATALLLGATVPALSRPDAANAAVTNPAAVVNPLLGTSNAGNTFPGADAPFGMVQWSPDTTTRPAGGGYAYADSAITGFSLTHISGPGCDILGDLPILPTTGGVDGAATATFTHADEDAEAGYYGVTLGNGVRTELTATTRSGMGRFTFPSTSQANLLFKLDQGATSTGTPSFAVVNDHQVRGSVSGGRFCGRPGTYTLYYDVLFDRAFSANGTFPGGASLTFDATANRRVQAKVGLSFVSTTNAAANRAAENTGWNFAGTRASSQNAWNDLLGRIQITGGTADQQTTFYTALYHSLLHPNVVSDSNGQYRGLDGVVHTTTDGRVQYGNYSGWDIYRSQAQLHALLAPEAASDSAQSMLNDYDQGGQLPKWTLNDDESFIMNGDPAAPIIAGYHAFGARNFDTAKAKAALVAQGTRPNPDRPGLNYMAGKGYLPADGSYGCCYYYGSVSTTLEYAAADFAVGTFAGALGDSATQKQFTNRARSWRNVLNPASGFVQPRLADGTWKTGFDPAEYFLFGPDFVEGSSWQYTGMVLHDIRGLTEAKGGTAAMRSYLDNVLTRFNGGGQYAEMGNEPSLGLPWEYDYVGQPHKTQQTVRRVQTQLWNADPAAWKVGNDDLGAMSSWYVWSALGMYPVTPGTADLALGSPLFTKAVITLPGGKAITINAPQAATDAPYVQSLKRDGSAWNNAYLPPSFVRTGGTLDYTLGSTANTGWASAPSAAPPSYPGDGGAQPPYLSAGPTGPLTSGIAGKCADVANGSRENGAKVQSYACNGTQAQNWTMGTEGAVQAQFRCLDVTSSGRTDGTPVQLYRCNGTGAQQWRYDATTRALVNPRSGKCLDVPGSSTTNGVQLQIYGCNGTNAQRWTVPQ
ncbi:lectin [Micromonospora lupini]|uniref:lectin n=1 Tax=Micromonospora lupini TaxID=285679 RepID=UPI0031D331A7